MDRIGKYEDLNKKYMELESRSMGIAKEESKRKGFEGVESELAVKKNEIKTWQGTWKDEVFGREASSNGKKQGSNWRQQRYFEHNQYVVIEKMTKTDEQMDEVAEPDAFLVKIENRDFAFLPLAREFVEERD